MQTSRIIIYKEKEVEMKPNTLFFGKLLKLYPQIKKIERVTGINKYGQYYSSIYINGNIYLPTDPHTILSLYRKEYVINFEKGMVERC